MAPHPKVFISHAAADEELVRKFVEMLRLGVDVPRDRIFCTCLQGMGIPAGKNFVSFIRDELLDCRFVISILTPSYYESQFCMSELGATWVLDDLEFFPILVPPLNYEHLKAVLTGAHSGSIVDKDFLSKLHDRLRSVLKLGSADTPNWEVNRDAFIKAFPKLVIKNFSNVPFAELQKADQKYEAAQTILQSKNAPEERIPRQFSVQIFDCIFKGEAETMGFCNGVPLGDRLTDNVTNDDGYRFHDAFHLAYAAVLGWSPVTRYILGVKRKSDKDFDQNQDGGRAIAIEEGISALVYSYAEKHKFLAEATA